MSNIRMLWRDEGCAIERDRGLTSSLLILALAAAGIAYFDARDDLYELLESQEEVRGAHHRHRRDGAAPTLRIVAAGGQVR